MLDREWRELKKVIHSPHTSPFSTVRKWHGRWKIKGLAGLEEMSRRPHNCPNAISQEVRKHVIAIKKGKKTLSISRAPLKTCSFCHCEPRRGAAISRKHLISLDCFGRYAPSQ